MTLTFRRDKDSPLTEEEFDGNTDEIAAVKTRTTALEAEAIVSIVDIALAGDQLTITLSNDDTFTFTVPTRAINDVGTWQPFTDYNIDDYFDDDNGGFFRVIRPHTSAATFDEGANDGLGHNFYRRLFHSPGNSFPTGGEAGQAIVKLSATDFDKAWRFIEALNVDFSPSSSSALVSDNVADALEELEALIDSAIASALSGLDAADISYSPTTASGLAADNVGDALEELATRGFEELTGTILPAQRDATVTDLGTTSGTVSLDPALGDVFKLTPNGAVTLNAASAPANAKITLIITTSGTSSFNVTPNTNFKSQGVLATGTVSGKVFSISFVGNGTLLVETGRTAAM